MTSHKGRFVSVEGIEGVGKSTNIEFIRNLIETNKHEVIVTREPGGTELGEEIRSLLLGHREDNMSDITELLLMFAARAEHLHKVIIPSLSDGKWVVCDRFTDATFAYQGGGRNMDKNLICQLENLVQQGLKPDITILLDLPVEIGLERAGQRSAPDRFESEKIDFFHRVRDAYLELAQQEPQRFHVIDASQALADVQQDIKNSLTPYLE
jgi:dTMP kinase